MKIQFTFPNQQIDLHIQLIDNPTARQWADHFYGYQAQANLQNFSTAMPYDAGIVKKCLDDINDLLDELAAFDYACHLPRVGHIDHIDRAFTNRLHRFFTHTQSLVTIIQWPDLRPFSQEQDARRVKLTDWLQQLNENIHTIERYMPPVHQFPDSYQELYICAECGSDKEWWNIDENLRTYHSKQPADVILGSQILGKTLLRSYLDGDDPNDWDTSGHHTNNGCIQILFDQTRQEIYNSQDFKLWLRSHGVDPELAFYDFPIGNVIDKSVLLEISQQLKTKTASNLVPVEYVARFVR